MKETTMAKDWRTIQFFLDEDGVQEVELQYDDPSKLRCTCVSRTQTCKHVQYVRDMFKRNNGVFDLEVPIEEDDDAMTLAFATAESFRQLILKYGKVAVVD
jgi:hypothetical protein